MTLKIQVLGWDRHRNVAVLTRLMGCQPSQHSEFNDTVFQISVWVFNCNFIRTQKILEQKWQQRPMEIFVQLDIVMYVSVFKTHWHTHKIILFSHDVLTFTWQRVSVVIFVRCTKVLLFCFAFVLCTFWFLDCSFIRILLPLSCFNIIYGVAGERNWKQNCNIEDAFEFVLR